IFMPMFIQGMAGVNRRLYDGGATYLFAHDVIHWNVFMSISAWLLSIAQIPFLVNIFLSLRTGATASDNPWEATTVEWSAPNRPPHGNFLTTPKIFRGPYEYSQPGHATDFTPQTEPAGA
ncbi:MAG: cytochrome C oxidase subunit I, partial [Verrucomicrobiae bacterium]|nr:cytochrome C oxidase subunit I [Verrucomicrobiae bacterium]